VKDKYGDVAFDENSDDSTDESEDEDAKVKFKFDIIYFFYS
jgi:hypothetical protein